MIHARRSAELVIELVDSMGGAQGRAPFLLAGPQDVLTLTPAAIIGRKPAPGTQDAEVTRAAHVELAEPDLPWRYSPEPIVLAGGVKPWMVLVVGETGIEVTAVEDNRVKLTGTVFATHNLARSAAWAHVHETPGRPISRILCPRTLAEGRDWTAVLVPAWRVVGDDLVPAWDNNTTELTLPCFDSWRFRTVAEDDDFRAIAQRLLPLTTEEQDALEASGFGRANITASGPGAIRGPGARLVSKTLPLSGALGVTPAPVIAALPRSIARRTQALAAVTRHKGRWVLGLPRYDEPWTARPYPEPTGGWRRQLREDPRHRGVAGLGAWAAISWQDRIADGATAQAGALALLSERVRNLAIGLRAARSQWTRRVPEYSAEALAVLGPMLGRIPTSTTTSVLDDLSDRTPWLVPALFSSAARRMLRPRSPLARAAAPGGTRLPGLIEIATWHCAADPPELPGQEDIPGLVGDPGTVEYAAESLSSPDRARYLLEKLYAANPYDQGFDVDRLAGSFDYATGHELFDLVAGRRENQDPRRVCRPVDMDAVGDSVCNAVDPTQERPVIIDRVFDGVTGLREPALAAPDLALELNIPLWSFLRDASPDWLLPGAGTFPLDRVRALQTNPEFVDAFLMGANQESLGELRWRNVPITAGWTPLRRFWQRISDDGSTSATDVRPVLDITSPPLPGAPTWPVSSDLGDTAHQSGTPAAMLVVLLHTELFRRYPATQVYLVPAASGPDPWDGEPPDADNPATVRVHPNLNGTLHPELVFFGFPLPPSAASSHWLVLEEPPPGFRFRAPNNVPGLDPNLTDGGTYAVKTLNRPIRAFFGNLL
jgi:hypothetical protein